MEEENKQTEDKDYRHIVRVVNTDLDGSKSVGISLTKIKGVGKMYGNLACKLAGVDQSLILGKLTDAQIQKLDEVILNPLKYGAPKWILNRRFDPESGEDKHLLSSDLKFAQETDVKLMKKTKSYRGMRHAVGLPTRGQRTRSNFRRNKGKVMGVKRSNAGKK
jgi:small subunit ribosomal protein S13